MLEIDFVNNLPWLLVSNLAIVLSDLPQFTDSDYPFGSFKLLLICMKMYLKCGDATILQQTQS
jgi:hypothetical protein